MKACSARRPADKINTSVKTGGDLSLLKQATLWLSTTIYCARLLSSDGNAHLPLNRVIRKVRRDCRCSNAHSRGGGGAHAPGRRLVGELS
jgi:hypothetical protein